MNCFLNELVDSSVLWFRDIMLTMETAGIAQLSFDSTDDFDKKVFNELLVSKSMTLVKSMWFATEEASALICLLELSNKDVFEVGTRIW